jgi:drug/metabolite transporter (DMT)-like permease
LETIIQNLGWFGCTIIATIIYGVLNFMYKVAAIHNCSAHKILNASATTVSFLSLIAILVSGSKFDNIWYILFFAIINSAFFGLGSIMKIKSLERIPTSIAFPVTKLDSVFLIIYSLIIFGDNPTFYQWIGIGISISMMAFISLNIKDKDNNISENENFSSKFQTIGLLFAILAAFSTSISMLTGKFASTSVNKLNYMFISYSLVMVYTYFINKIFYSKKSKVISKEIIKKTYLFGIIIGILNFTGYFLVLNAFAIGPLSLIQGISSNAFIIPIILSFIVFKENLNSKKIIVIIMAIIAILMLKF